MSNHEAPPLLEALLDSWNRNNQILVGLLQVVPPGGLEVRAMPSSPTVAEMFTHMHFVRLVFVAENLPELAPSLPSEEWAPERDPKRIEAMLNHSAQVVRDAFVKRLEANQPMDLHYDHPILLLQHMIWHDGYHHGQIKLALKLAGSPISDKIVSPVTWGRWMNKTTPSSR